MYKRGDSYMQTPNPNYPMNSNQMMQPVQQPMQFQNPVPPQMFYDGVNVNVQPPTGQIDQFHSLPPQMQMPYDQRYYASPQINKPPVLPPVQTQSYQPMNIVQKLSMIIKSQMHTIQPMVKNIAYKHADRHKSRRSRSYSHSRSRSRDRHQRKSSSSKDPMQWLCKKCSFSNFEWRQKCKRCGEIHYPKGFTPGPEDWRCHKCSNINYARRSECNRCKNIK